MKKSLIAIALAAMVAPAWAAEVVSSNIVGYEKITIQPGLTIVGQQFQEIGGGARNIQTIVGDNMSEGGVDTLRVWDGTEYSDYYYFSDSDDINGDGTAAWGDEDWLPVDVEIPVGTGMWIDAQNVSTLTFSGEVGTNTLDFAAGLNLIIPPQPKTINIQDIKAEGLTDGGVDTLRIWDGTEYSDYYYFAETDDINGDGTAAWGDEDWLPVDVEIPAGTGMWLDAQQGGTLTIESSAE